MLKISVFPKRKTAEAFAAKACAYTVSLGGTDERKRLMLDGYAWATEHFEDVIVCFGDGPLLEASLQTLGVPSDEVVERGQHIATEVMNGLNAIKPVTAIAAASILSKDAVFRAKRALVYEAFSKNASLRSAVEHDANQYVQRLTRKAGLGIPQAEALSLARGHILYEIVMYAFISEQGFQVDVYAGEELPTLKHFIQGRLTGFPELARRICISLKQEH